MTKNNALYYLPLGGAGEIGMNMYLYGFGGPKKRRWIMVDAGIGFPNAAFAPGVEIMMPDVSFLDDPNETLDAIFITHAHEDHIGAIGHLWRRLRAPVYATKFAAEIARRKLEEAGSAPGVVETVKPGHIIEAGAFEVSFFGMTHSIPDANALIIRSPHGAIFHTGDFKIDESPMDGKPMDQAALKALGDSGVLAVMCDSTNVLEPGRARGESEIVNGLRAAIRGCEGRVAATTFASNVARLKSLAEAARAEGREIVIAGRAMRRMIETALRTGVIDEFPTVTPEDRADTLPPHKVFYLVTGSQGEGRAALARIANGAHPGVRLDEGDTVIFSSKTIPGNESEVIRIWNKLAERGISVIAESRDIHVSGHAKRDELERIYELLRPQIAVPMHGEQRHLMEHRARALSWGAGAALVATNGQIVRVAPGAPEVVEEVEAGVVYLDGALLVGAMDGVVRARRKVALSGHAAIAIVIDDSGELIADPEIKILGLPLENSAWEGDLEELAIAAIDAALGRLAPKARRSDAAVEEASAQAARRVIAKHTGKKPETSVIVMRLEDEA